MTHTFLTPEHIEELKRTNATVLLVDSDIPCYSIGFMAKDDSSPKFVENSVDNFLLKMKRKLDASHYICFLTDGKSNFRNTYATTAPYKGNRVNLERPKWYVHIKEYLGSKWKGQTMVGIEADDALTIAATYLTSLGIRCIICSLDKDLLQMPCEHYDWTSDMLRVITEAKGEYNLWKQMITGDVATDNIPGLSDSAWAPTEPFKTPVFDTYMKVPNEGPHLHPYLRPTYIGGEVKTTKPMVPKGKSIVSSRGLKTRYGNSYLDIFNNILDEHGVCQGEFSPVDLHTPAATEKSHCKLVGWEDVVDLTYVKGLLEDYYGDTTSYNMLDSTPASQHPSMVLSEYISAYWDEGLVQELDDPGSLGEQRFNEVFSLVYMLRDVSEIPDCVKNTAFINFTPLVFQAKDYDDFDGDDTDADDPDFDF